MRFYGPPDYGAQLKQKILISFEFLYATRFLVREKINSTSGWAKPTQKVCHFCPQSFCRGRNFFELGKTFLAFLRHNLWKKKLFFLPEQKIELNRDSCDNFRGGRSQKRNRREIGGIFVTFLAALHALGKAFPKRSHSQSNNSEFCRWIKENKKQISTNL